MKKLLLLLFSILISFNSYGEWTKTNEDIDGNGYYIDFETVKKLDNGYVVWWSMVDADFNNDGNMSGKFYFQGDCNLSRTKFLSVIQYTEPMGQGDGQDVSGGMVELEDIMGWSYPPPDSIGLDDLKTVCTLADQSSMNNYQSKVLELIAEYESYEWDDDSSYGASATPEVGETFTADIAGSLSSKSFPPNAYPSGNSWKCNSGYERYNNGCRPEVIVREEQQKKNQLEAERAAEKLAFEKEQYNRLLTQEVQAEQDLARQLIIEDQLNTLKSAYINNINAQVYNLWNFRGAQKGWGCDVYVLQDVDGNIQAVDVQNCTLDDSSQARAFKDSIERAVYKASPLPAAPDDAVFSRELLFYFRAN